MARHVGRAADLILVTCNEHVVLRRDEIGLDVIRAHCNCQLVRTERVLRPVSARAPVADYQWLGVRALRALRFILHCGETCGNRDNCKQTGDGRFRTQPFHRYDLPLGVYVLLLCVRAPAALEARSDRGPGGLRGRVTLVTRWTQATRAQRRTASGRTVYHGNSQRTIGSQTCVTRPLRSIAGTQSRNATITPVAIRPDAR